VESEGLDATEMEMEIASSEEKYSGQGERSRRVNVSTFHHQDSKQSAYRE